MPHNKQLIPILDVYRLLGALIVVLVHYELIFGHFVIFGTIGTTALSWFFIVSGFILSYNYPALNSWNACKVFYAHRLVRIYPTYFLAIAFSSCFMTLVYSNIGENFFTEVHRAQVLTYDLPEEKSTWFFIWATLRHMTFTQSISSIETLKYLFNGPLWSLVLEMYFYLFYPLFLMMLRSINTRQRIFVAFFVGYFFQFALIQLFLPEAESYDLGNLNVPVYTNPLVRCAEFISGMLLFRLFLTMKETDHDAKTKTISVILATAAYVGISYLAYKYMPYQYSVFFTSIPILTYLVHTLVHMNWQPGEATLKFCGVLGGVSYVLYCFHWPLLEFIQYFDLLPNTLSFSTHLLFTCAILLMISYIIYQFVETPIRKVLGRLVRARMGG